MLFWGKGMTTNARTLFSISAVVAAVLAAGCSRNSAPDPASANLAPTDQYGQAQYAAAGEQLSSAPAPPPALPQYSQPACPGPDYMWNPGYWAYSQAGYYWVPGVWVTAPYVDALWTPPYWGYSDGSYRFHAGYWAQNIGFYGGINYGYGYTGLGYYGGYWSNGAFFYNRTVNNIRAGVVRNVYSHPVTNYTPANRVSYNGGPGGIERGASAAELAVNRESRVGPVAAQVEHARQASTNRGQFARENQGRPSSAALERPLETPSRAPAVASRPERQEARPGTAWPNEADRRVDEAPRPAAAQARPNPYEPRPAEPSRVESRPAPVETRPAPVQARSAPVQARSAPVQARSAPEPRSESRPSPFEVRPAQQQPRTAARPSPPPQQQAHPAAPPQERHPAANPPRDDGRGK